MAKQTKGEVVVVGFNYSALDTQVAEKVRAAAERIKDRVKRTLDDIIEVGNDLLTVKEALPHGGFLPWLRAEFGWGERMAQNFMSVAERFGVKSEMIADLKIAPTAAYLLAAPSAPDEARQVALERAEAGEQITAKEAKKILAQTRKKGKKRTKSLPTEKLGERLSSVLERYKKRWNPKELASLAQQLREFTDALEAQKKAGKKKAKE